MIANLSVIVAGSIFIMWIGELISEFGIGNGVSLIIFAGIVANIPAEVSQFIFTFDMANLPMYLLFLALGFLTIGFGVGLIFLVMYFLIKCKYLIVRSHGNVQVV